MFWSILCDLCSKKKITPTQLVTVLGISRGSVTHWKQGKLPHYQTQQKIADYFGVSVDYLLGREEREPSESTQPSVDDVKVALFGGDGEVTDEMWDEVKQYAEYIKAKYKKGNK